MAENKHTPGPWSFSKCTCGHPACRQFVLSNQGSVGFVEEDARLMAAATEMLSEVIRCAVELREAAKLLRDRFPGVAGIYDAAAQRAEMTAAKAERR